MKQTLLIAALFLVTLAVALFALGVFDRREPSDPAPVEVPAPGPAGMGGELGAREGEPKDEPEPELPEFRAPVRILLLADSHRSFSAWLEQMWDFRHQAIQWQAWHTNAVPEGVRTHSEGLPALERAPSAPDLEAVTVLVLCAFDPASMPSEFWARVADRVKSGSLGLLVIPDNRFTEATGAEPSLASVLPVRGVKPVRPTTMGGGDLPGVFANPVALRASEAGMGHPATRLVSFPGWSRRMWEQQASKAFEGRWETKFCAAVEGPVEGATVLVEGDAGATRWPAIVAHDSRTRRVLWVGGFFDLTDPAYRDSKSFVRFRAMTLSWIDWLASSGA